MGCTRAGSPSEYNTPVDPAAGLHDAVLCGSRDLKLENLLLRTPEDGECLDILALCGLFCHPHCEALIALAVEMRRIITPRSHLTARSLRPSQLALWALAGLSNWIFSPAPTVAYSV